MALLPDTDKINSILARVCERNDVPGLHKKVRVDWNARFTRRMGDAEFGKMLIRLSPRLFARASEKEQEETIAHEMAHLVAEYKFGSRISPHGGEWQACMLRAGYEPSRCHTVDRSGLSRTYKTCTTYCGCGKHMVTPKKYAKILKGIEYRCRACRVLLSIAPPVMEVRPKKQSKPVPKAEIVVTSKNLRSK